jgi:hypothetical protein
MLTTRRAWLAHLFWRVTVLPHPDDTATNGRFDGHINHQLAANRKTKDDLVNAGPVRGAGMLDGRLHCGGVDPGTRKIDFTTQGA